MQGYVVPLREYDFLLNEAYNVGDLSKTETFTDATPDLFASVLTEAARFAEGVLAPLNPPAVDAPCRYSEGKVETPEGFKAAYRLFADGGWGSLAALPDHGGAGLPHVLHTLVDEIISSANLGFSMYRGLNEGAYRAILDHGSDELKERYLPALVSGELLPAMNLTEPHCGSDLGLLRTRAEPVGDGRYKITGSKIFITGGEHDLTRNILHLVLARLPDAPAGSQGISLFLVPKYYADPQRGEEVRNAFLCGGIEHKMGLKGSATCAMNYDGAIGWLVGGPNSGLRAMFTMMNAARLAVGVQGVCAGEATLQIAQAYAAERLQGNAPDSGKGAGPDPIARHPDVERMLRTQKALTQGGRGLAVQMALALDLSHAVADPQERAAHDEVVQLLTPIVKACLTDGGFESANLALQVLGGHGYIAESGVERWVRDIRIAAIYEGTNGIQALDLVGRKLSMKNGTLPDRYFAIMEDDFQAALADFPAAADGLIALDALKLATGRVRASSPAKVAAIATDYLSFFGVVAIAAQWCRFARTARENLAADPVFYQDKLETAAFYMARLLPRYLGLAQAITTILTDEGEDR